MCQKADGIMAVQALLVASQDLKIANARVFEQSVTK